MIPCFLLGIAFILVIISFQLIAVNDKLEEITEIAKGLTLYVAYIQDHMRQKQQRRNTDVVDRH